MATAAQKDYYQILGVKRSASPEEVRKAYRRLARKLHPDVNPNSKTSEDKFKEIQEAYDVLGEEKKREFYDRVGFFSEQAFQQGAAGFAGPPPPAAGRGTPPPEFDFGGFDFEAGAGARRGGASFKDLFSSIFARQGEEEEQPHTGSDLEYQTTIGFWDAIRGQVLRLTVPHQERCPQCQGSGAGGRAGICPECQGKGQVAQSAGGMRFNLKCATCGGTGKVGARCPRCHGQGSIAGQEALEVRIKPGTREGARLRVPGKGNWGAQGSGDLYIVIHIQPHPLFRREGDDITVPVPVSIAEAALGAKIEVPTIDGHALLKIPPGTQPGQRFRMRERGVPSAQHEGVRGDQYVEVRVTVPQVRDERSKELLREIAKLNPMEEREALLRQAAAQ